jgi:hypothetical protein
MTKNIKNKLDALKILSEKKNKEWLIVRFNYYETENNPLKGIIKIGYSLMKNIKRKSEF